ncbi:gamma-glutamyl-gamma-aminobutyrate hydrolase family protein [Planococcus sp. A6]|uniref:gamma-glutamyl-gamma-aminobutyrate hydrolase family protein n=1 Tax=Planococcus sp. A6 TaxID=2992760 RepID=UPI00237B8B43|nr:gamma-glutamyl-gamma-aminobutyrate hydrolase family protein [Planococcus sp. A6]MDE0582594.1 gamma-glutamyl-gamma-aminobutyrate hydrolase family protein [Planococcus sp. A6]
MRPIIGITASKELGKDEYNVELADTEAIVRAGGLPIMLPHIEGQAELEELAEHIDGLFLAGGWDIDPTLFGEEPHPGLGVIIPSRDRFELELLEKVMEKNKPVLAICRGAQILNIAAGGDMYQDTPSQLEGNLLQHQQRAPKEHGSHFVEVAEGSLLHRLTDSLKLKVNSRHHQSNRHVPEHYLVSGIASDGVIEAIESKEHGFALGLQWHPENMARAGDVASLRIFEGFVSACTEEGDE